MLLFMWFLVAFGPALGIATTGYDASCYTFATTASTTITIPPTTIVETLTVTTGTRSGRDLAADWDSVIANPSSPPSAGADQNVTLDAWRIETLVRCGGSTSTLYETISWTTASEPATTSSIDSYTSASTSSSLSPSTYESVAPSPYSSDTAVSPTSYSESSITSAIQSSSVESSPPYNASLGYSPSTYSGSSFSSLIPTPEAPTTASSSAEATTAISNYSASGFSAPSYTPSLGSPSSAETTMSTYTTPGPPSSYITPKLSSYTSPSLSNSTIPSLSSYTSPSLSNSTIPSLSSYTSPSLSTRSSPFPGYSNETSPPGTSAPPAVTSTQSQSSMGFNSTSGSSNSSQPSMTSTTETSSIIIIIPPGKGSSSSLSMTVSSQTSTKSGNSTGFTTTSGSSNSSQPSTTSTTETSSMIIVIPPGQGSGSSTTSGSGSSSQVSPTSTSGFSSTIVVIPPGQSSQTPSLSTLSTTASSSSVTISSLPSISSTSSLSTLSTTASSSSVTVSSLPSVSSTSNPSSSTRTGSSAVSSATTTTDGATTTAGSATTTSTTTADDAPGLTLPPVGPTPSRPADEPSSEPEPSITRTSSSSLSTTTTFSSVSFTPTPTANATAQVIVPHYQFKISNTSYYWPLCSDPAQVLWFTTGDGDHRELHNFTLTCRGITCNSGEFFPLPTEVQYGDCQDTTMCGGLSFCFWRRFDQHINEDNTITCDAMTSSRLQSRGPCSDNEVCSNITKIADKLAGLRNVANGAGSAAEQGLATVGCAAQQAFQQTAAHYFAMAQKQWTVLEKNIEMIKEILTVMFGLNKMVVLPVQLWIDQNDEAFQELVCYIDDDGGSRIWRTMEKHSSLHAGLNALNSMNDIINHNLILVLFEIVFKNLIQDLHAQYAAYITSSGHIIQGWTQAWRLCTTKWDSGSLQNPEEKPDEDDEDDWLPRYEILTKPDASVSAIRSMEHALSNQGWEAVHDSHIVKAYVADLNIMQALLPQTMPFVDNTYRFVWGGPKDHTKSARSFFQEELNLKPFGMEQLTSGNASRNMKSPAQSEDLALDFDPFHWPEPTGSQRVEKPEGNFFKSLSQQKGQDLGSFDYYTHAEGDGEGEGSWIFILDSGFDLTHPNLAATDYRKVKTYVAPNEFRVPGMPQELMDEGWGPAPAVIDDDDPDLEGFGHGTPGKSIACVAAGLGEIGVASRANLYLFKYGGHVRNSDTGDTIPTQTTHAGMVNVLTKVTEILEGDEIPRGRAVILISADFRVDAGFAEPFKWFLEAMDNVGAVVVIPSGNHGYDEDTGQPLYYQSERTPVNFATDASPYINVGATYHDGSIAEFTTPQGTPEQESNPDDPSISMWAQGVDVYTCLPMDSDEGTMMDRSGTSYSGPTVAGLAAYMLSYPWPEGQNPFDPESDGGSVGRRMKTMLADTYAYQRLPRDKLIARSLEEIKKRNGHEEFPWEVPATVKVAYNMAYGHQKCKNVEGFPNLKRDADSCPIPGSGGADGETTGSIFYTGDPTYMPSDWTGFSTATGSIHSTTDNATETTSWDSSTFMTFTTRPGSGTSSSSSTSTSLSTVSWTLTLNPPTSSEPSTSSTSEATSTSLSTVSWTLTLNPPTSSESSTSSTSESTTSSTSTSSTSTSSTSTSSSSTSSSSAPTPTLPAISATCRQRNHDDTHVFSITDIRGEWATADWGNSIVEHADDCCNVDHFQFFDPDATGSASMDIFVIPDGEGWPYKLADWECVTLAIKKAGGPENSFCFMA